MCIGLYVVPACWCSLDKVCSGRQIRGWGCGGSWWNQEKQLSAQRRRLEQLLQHVYKLLDHGESLRYRVCLEGAGHVLKSNLHGELGEPGAKAMKSEKKKWKKKNVKGELGGRCWWWNSLQVWMFSASPCGVVCALAADAGFARMLYSCSFTFCFL